MSENIELLSFISLVNFQSWPRYFVNKSFSQYFFPKNSFFVSLNGKKEEKYLCHGRKNLKNLDAFLRPLQKALFSYVVEL